MTEPLTTQLKKLGKKLGLDSLEITLWPKKDGDTEKQADAPPDKETKKFSLTSLLEQANTENKGASNSLLRSLTGMVGTLGEYHFPSDVLGGSCPLVAGEEEDLVWNAAAEACDTERVHIVWQTFENKIWYLAVRSNELASHAGSWCPFASLLPGMKDAAPLPVCYTYYSEETATMMAVSQDGLSIYRGTTLVVRAKAERTARELGDAPIIDLIPDSIMKLSPAPWYSTSLFEERSRRVLATLSVIGALSFAALAFVIWLFASMSLLSSKHDLAKAQERTKSKTMELLRVVQNMRVSPMHDQLAAFADVNDGLLAVNGFLEVYEIQNGKARWRAIVPPNVTADRISAMNGKTIETTPTGIAIGNTNQIEFEATPAGRR